jgi:hypothetical protein
MAEYAAKKTNTGRDDPGPVGATNSVLTVTVTKAPLTSNTKGVHFCRLMGLTPLCCLWRDGLPVSANVDLEL